MKEPGCARCGQILLKAGYLGWSPERLTESGIVPRRVHAGPMPRCLLFVALALPSAGVEVCLAYPSLATQNLGLIEVPDSLSAVPYGSKMSFQLVAFCSKRSDVGTSLYSFSLMRNVYQFPLKILLTLFLTDLHVLSPFTRLFR